MAKSLQAELLAILRKYELAGELTKRKEIINIKSYPERQLSRLIQFTFSKQTYFVLYDTSAGDDVAVVLDHIKQDIPSIEGRLIRNPLEGSMKAYGMPHMGKDVYLFVKIVKKTRLDHEVVTRYPEFTRSTIQKYIKAGYVTVDGRPATAAKQEVTENSEITLTPPTPTDTSAMTLPILYIDDSVIVVDKPAGVLTHSKGALNDEFTVADFFRRYTTHALETSRPGIVHRLDRDTSGVIIGARNDEAAALLKKQFANRTTKKTYAAVVEGTPKLPEATIDLPIGRNPSTPSMFKVDPKGKEALTNYKVIQSNEKFSLLELLPKTGRTHQLRVHAQYIKNPIAGDRVYGKKDSAPRLCLHAKSLEITLPGSTRKVFSAPVPELFDELTRP